MSKKAHYHVWRGTAEGMMQALTSGVMLRRFGTAQGARLWAADACGHEINQYGIIRCTDHGCSGVEYTEAGLDVPLDDMTLESVTGTVARTIADLQGVLVYLGKHRSGGCDPSMAAELLRTAVDRLNGMDVFLLLQFDDVLRAARYEALEIVHTETRTMQ